MTITAWVPLFVAVIGLILWLIPNKLSKAGEYMFIIGTFWATYAAIGEHVRIGH